jgi:hypothetical protein
MRSGTQRHSQVRRRGGEVVGRGARSDRANQHRILDVHELESRAIGFSSSAGAVAFGGVNLAAAVGRMEIWMHDRRSRPRIV